MIWNIDDFKKAVENGLFRPSTACYGYIDRARFINMIEKRAQDKKHITIVDAFKELKNRMSSEYYEKVFLAQAQAMHYAGIQFPTYSMVMAEDLTEDWLATVDFHKKHARDHSLHQPLTAYIAAKLLGFGDEKKALKIPVSPGNLLDRCVSSIFHGANFVLEFARKAGMPETLLDETNNNAKAYWKKVFYDTVVLSALFHDMGYPWQYVGRIDKALGKCVPLFSSTKQEAQKIVGLFGNRIVFLPFYHYTNRYNPPVNEQEQITKLVGLALDSHGFPGALSFLALNDSIRKTHDCQFGSKIKEISVELAALGIFMHDMVSLHSNSLWNLRIDFEKDPLSCIICLADYLEEFDRPQIEFTSSQKTSKMKFERACSKAEAMVDRNGNLQVNMKYIGSTQLAIARKFKTEETNSYFNSSNGFIDMSSLGIRDVLFNANI